MSKITVYDINGTKLREINSDLFDGELREDIVQKIVEIQKTKQLYAPYLWAGMETSASGNVKHLRHSWKTDRGKGLSRYPKKRMSDKGDRFVWVAAVVPGVRKGRRAHPPKTLRMDKRMNKKELVLGLKSALAMVSSLESLKKKYSRLNEKTIKINLPLIVDSKILSLKSKEFFKSMQKILGNDLWEVATQEKKVRAGIGKMRGNKYKKNAGMLLVIGNKEEKKISGIEVVKVKDLKLINMAINGARLTMFTESSIKDLEEKMNKFSGDKK